MTEKCPKCQREWKGQAPCDQTVCIEMFGECIPCRFLPTTHPNNTRGSGRGTDAELKAIEAASKVARAKVGAGRTAIVTRKMITAAHGVTLHSGDIVLSARLLERIYLAMEQAAPPPQTPFNTCPTCEALDRTVMMERGSNGL